MVTIKNKRSEYENVRLYVFDPGGIVQDKSDKY